MKCRLLFILVLLGFQSLAQAPQQINFQGVLRDNAGAAIRNQQVTIVVSFREFSAETLRYRESHTTSTDNFGLIQLSLGTGTVVSGTFGNINWASEQISFLATATLPNGNVVEISEQKFLSVPYALHATTATSLSGEDDTDVTNELNESMSLNGSVLTVTDAGGDVSLDLSAIDNQTLQVNGTNLSIQNGNQVDLGFLEDDADADPTNELQYLALNGTVLSIENGNQVDLASLEDDADADPANEIQHLSLSGSTLSLSGSDEEINLTGIGVEADDQTAAQVPYDGTAAQMDADNVQEGLDELAVEKVRNLQEAYAANSLITLNGTNELQINTSTGAPLFRTNNAGQIGIGTAVTDATLDIGSNDPNAHAQLELSNSDGSHRLNLFSGRTDANPFISVFPNDALRFAHYNGTTLTERMRIANNGNIGIGTNAPAHRMHIVGQTSPLTGMDDIESFAGSIETGVVFDVTKAGSEARTAGIVARSGGGDENFGVLGITNNPEAVINRGVFGISTGADSNMGVSGNAIGTATYNTGSYGFAKNATYNYGVAGIASDPALLNVGVYGAASGGTSNYAGYFLGNVNIVSGSLRFNNIPYLHLGNGNFSIGETTRNNLTTAAGNIALGNGSLQDITANFDNVGIGLNALANLSTGNNNVAIGRYPMNNATSGNDNVAIGHSVLATNTTGSNNIALGYLMLRSNTTGSSNIAFGNHAMDNNITGSHNVAIGQYAGTLITNQNDNVLVGRNTNIANNAERGVAIGYNARVGQNDAVVLGDPNNSAVRVGVGTQTPAEKLHIVGNGRIDGSLNVSQNFSINGVVVRAYDRGNGNLAFGNTTVMPLLTSGLNNVAVGDANMNSLTTGSYNVAVGTDNLTAAPTASQNVAIGTGSLRVTSGERNIAVGNSTMSNAPSGDDNVAIGTGAMNTTSGSRNIAMGSGALAQTSSGNNNIAIGYNSLFYNGAGSNNIAIGSSSLQNTTTGEQNIVFGSSAANSLTTGSSNVAIGTSSDILSNAQRAVAIGYQSRVSQSDAIVLGDPNNGAVRVGIGTQAPTEKLDVNGNIYVTGIVTGPSDRRLKTDITPLNNALATVEKLDGVSYFWNNNNPNKDIKQFGLIAQDLEKVLPELVQTKPDGYKSVNYTSLIPFLIEAIKEQQKEIEKLKSENADLKSTMESKIDALAVAVKTLETSVNSKSQQTLSSDEK